MRSQLRKPWVRTASSAACPLGECAVGQAPGLGQGLGEARLGIGEPRLLQSRDTGMMEIPICRIIHIMRTRSFALGRSF